MQHFNGHILLAISQIQFQGGMPKHIGFIGIYCAHVGARCIVKLLGHTTLNLYFYNCYLRFMYVNIILLHK